MNRILRFLRRFMLQKTIYRTFLVYYLLGNLLLLVLLGMLSIRDSTRMITEEVIRSSNKVMEQAAQGLSFNLEETKRSLLVLASNQSVGAIMRHAEVPDMAYLLQHERNISEITQSINTYQSLISDVLILGKNGYVNNLNGRSSLWWEYSFGAQPWAQESFQPRQGDYFFSLGIHHQDYYLSSDISRYGRPTLSVAMQVKGFRREVIGSVIANLDLQKVNSMFERNNYQNRGSIFLIDENRRIIVHQNNEEIGQIMDIAGIDEIYEQKSGNFRTPLYGEEHLIIYQPTAVEGWMMISAVPMSEITSQSAPLKSNLARILYLCLILNVLISLAVTFRISRPMQGLLKTLDKIGTDDMLYIRDKNYQYHEINQIGMKFKELMDRIDLLIQQNYLTQIALKEEELKALQAQINPHFLFNTLQLLQTEIVCGNIESSNHIVLSLSHMFRYSMRQSGELVELRTELEHVRNYLYIMNKKYDDRLQVDEYIPDQRVLPCRIPKLLLQPVVENCIRHGFGEDRREGAIRISVTTVRRGLLIAISDSGKGMDADELKRLRRQLDKPDEKNGNIGLYNINHRIKLNFGQDFGIRVRSTKNAGTCVYLVVPRIE
ncbi:cache domain-containing sensor histidine kinase [Paenibacillus woosongensis]|uniref:Sensor histidine kinase n=1 Tax=Paenibacillus woosongensis TaxID=307580 RepID=A0ABQ4MYT3_9BACL|nr:sensor histidine kinase [Paenibacillus woosongensis]GIP61067.1 sensor histidine kinase [Paenibacillus woosongensis]